MVATQATTGSLPGKSLATLAPRLSPTNPRPWLRGSRKEYSLLNRLTNLPMRHNGGKETGHASFGRVSSGKRARRGRQARQGKRSKVGPCRMANLSTQDTSSSCSSHYTIVPAALSLQAMTV